MTNLKYFIYAIFNKNFQNNALVLNLLYQILECILPLLNFIG